MTLWSRVIVWSFVEEVVWSNCVGVIFLTLGGNGRRTTSVKKTTVTTDKVSTIGLKTGSTSEKAVHETKTTYRIGGVKIDTSISTDLKVRNIQKSTVVNKLLKLKTGAIILVFTNTE
jgi:TATA-box binding protein (TBP) (component of TFIID and TFIIIB)